MTSQIAIIDLGSQFTQLIARKLRENKCYSQIYSPEGFVFSSAMKGIILSGSHKSIDEYVHYRDLVSEILDVNSRYGVPVLGICYGKQLISDFFGARVVSGEKREYGKAELQITGESLITENIKERSFTVWMSHGDTVATVPDGFRGIARTEDCEFAVIANDQKKLYGFQFHPEVSHSENGEILLRNFIEISRAANTWDLQIFSNQEKRQIIQSVGESHVLAAVSGGVDSTVAAKFMYEAIGSRLHCIFVDTGLLRKNEVDEVKKSFFLLGIPLEVISASHQFFDRLACITEPEEKRKIIGETFINVFESKASTIENVEFLLQGTLYPDIVESGVSGSHAIKSHHNVGGLPVKMGLKLLEPFRLLFKDEVRAIGRNMGVDETILMRHPSPGPGLAIRILGEVTEEKVRILQNVDDIYLSTMRRYGLYSKIWQAFTVLLPIRSVGVMGDKRSYNYVCAVRAVTSRDGMTASAYPFESDSSDKILFLEFLNEIATKIPNQVKEVSRIVYDITSKPPATIEWE
ncbi:GMP synthase [Neorickettsia helminthoeca str. Oregon]|uniref:GMP synthase (glutamine-hydrolyzing) n=1 Tax=Neorickettsia helminthoeca str. Oregon TaxID=1286528 RepID=X5GXH8_9RICK|nr:glutamine-hydrolyzing GMP synthase [Neorickettsia helminthoeca]AHX11762.1 GMP synthase [Neorickettsia helminthoeca str. Oregon]